MHVRECMDKMPLWTFVNKRPIYIYIYIYIYTYTLYLHTDEHQCSRISKSLLPTLARQLHRFLVGHDAGRYAKIAPITSSGFDGGTRFSQSSCLATWMFSQRYWRLINEDLSSLVKTQDPMCSCQLQLYTWVSSYNPHHLDVHSDPQIQVPWQFLIQKTVVWKLTIL